MSDDRIKITGSDLTTEALLSPQQAEGCTLVLYGAGGDLAKRKIIPALLHLERDGLLPEHFAVVGTARSQRTREQFLAAMREGLDGFSRTGPVEPADWERLAARMDYVPSDFSDPQGFACLARTIAAAGERQHTSGNRLFFLATPPSAVPGILKGLTGAGLIERHHPVDHQRWDRVIFEKPFGRDLTSALELNKQAAQHLAEEQIFRIDHYLGKETVQNILVFRFANAIFEPIWNRQHVSHVEITAAESLGVGGRAAFYDEAGALRDLIQNHLLQVMSLVAMEPPVDFLADSIRDEKAKVFRSLRPIAPDEVSTEVVRGQYQGYRDEPGVRPESTTETYLALRAYVDNWRWQDVPFYLRTGKHLAEKQTQVAIFFKRVPHCLFGDQNQCPELQDNILKINIQPDEGVSLTFSSKVPGEDLRVGGFTMDFRYAGQVEQQPREAYERLLHHAMRGDATLFARRDGVEASWGYVQPILDAWAGDDSIPLHSYDPGGSGPSAANGLTQRDGKRWMPLG